MPTLYEILKDDPKFKRFCAKQSTKPRLSWDEKFKRLRAARAAEFRAFCKPRGINSILKSGDYTSGRMIGADGALYAEEWRIVKISKDEWTSELQNGYSAEIEKLEAVSEPEPETVEPAATPVVEPDPVVIEADPLEARLIQLLEEQNELLRKLAA